METLNFNKILIALDYDESAQKVAEIGYSLAKTMNAKVILLHVVYESPIYYNSYMFMKNLSVDIHEDLKKSTEHFLQKTKHFLGDEAIGTLVVEGEIPEKIIETASLYKVDLIVMGSHSRKWLESILLGSTTEKVLEKSTIPLFIVPIKKQDK